MTSAGNQLREPRIGRAGGDMAAFWKGIGWGAMTGLDVVFKLSQRFVIDVPNWDQDSARLLLDSAAQRFERLASAQQADRS